MSAAFAALDALECAPHDRRRHVFHRAARRPSDRVSSELQTARVIGRVAHLPRVEEERRAFAEQLSRVLLRRRGRFVDAERHGVSFARMLDLREAVA
jgi:hypothetical protein